MDEEGFREYFHKKKRSPTAADIYIKMLKKYRNFLQKYCEHDKIDLSSVEDLLSFGNWLKEEKFQQPLVDMYKRALGSYFEFIEKKELAKIAENGFCI